MATIVNNTFTTYHLDNDEFTSGSVLSTNQRMLLQNELALKAEEKLSIEVDTERPLAHVQTYAWHDGYIAAIRYMLELSSALQEQEQSDQSLNYREPDPFV